MVYSVSELSNEIKTFLSKNVPDKLIVEGEISNLKNSNGNLFFTLKDSDSSISVVSWSYEKYFELDNLSNGDKVQVSGKLVCYSKNGTYSLQIFKLEKQGVGNLHTSYENLKKKYQDKGYFSDEIKKKFPENIKNIGIITSPEGAAIQDILFVLNKNKFQGRVFIKRCMVQGNMCPKSIADSIEYLNQFKFTDSNNSKEKKKKLDLILVTRGGGSFEDLMGYSDPKVIEAIYDSDIFVISAVGHEVDFMLSDFVADLRAPTPSIAAEIISKKQKEKIDNLKELEEYINSTIKNKILTQLSNYINKLELCSAKNKNPIDNLQNKINELESIQNKINMNIKTILHNYSLKINDLEKNLEKFNIDKLNDYGIAQIYFKKKEDSEFVKCNSINDIPKKPYLIKIILQDGELLITPKKIDNNSFTE